MTDNQSIRVFERALGFCIDNKLIIALMVIFVIVWGVLVAPFDWNITALPRDPVPVDAIPDIGENQQIVFTEWMGRSPQDVEDQITYPLTVALLGLPDVKTVRSFSMFGFSSIYIIFKEEADFYWSRSRVLEKLNSLPAGTLPGDVSPTLGPDATGLGQIFWYTLEGHDENGKPTGGWDLHELRTAQDWYVRYALQSVEGVAEVASVGGFVQEYQVDVDPDAMRAYGVTLSEVFNSVRMSNVDVGARTIEVNDVEYVIRGLGLLKSVADIEDTVIRTHDNVPVYIRNVASVSLGPALRRGALDKGGAEAVGAAVIARYGENPMATITRVKEKIEEIAPGLPRKTLADGTVSQLTVVPFYDRSGLIRETLGTLNTALLQEILVTIIVVLIMVFHIRSSILITGLLPLAVLMCFIAMKLFGVDANIVALSGIAIAIGTMVDMGVVICENILKHLHDSGPADNKRNVVLHAATEVGSAVMTAVLTTIVSFLPVFTMEAAEGKLFKPLAFTKTFALIASIIVALTVIPPFAHLLFGMKSPRARVQLALNGLMLLVGLTVGVLYSWMVGIAIVVISAFRIFEPLLPNAVRKRILLATNVLLALLVALILAQQWMPLGFDKGFSNHFFVVLLIGGGLAALIVFQQLYIPILRWCLQNKVLFLAIPSLLVAFGLVIWLGFGSVFGFIPNAMSQMGLNGDPLRNAAPWKSFEEQFPGLSKEFMPPLDEGSFLFMPSTMPHASIGKSVEMLHLQDMAIRSIPEVESVVGKIGRVESPLDPAPIGMVETIVNYKSEYISDQNGVPLRFEYDSKTREFVRDDQGELVPDTLGVPFRQWRDSVRNTDDIWNEISRVAQVPGMTGAPKLQPIAARIIMLQSGMRAPMGLKIYGPDLDTIEKVGLQVEALLKEVPEVRSETVIADRVVGKPYLEIVLDRKAIARHGIHIRQVQDVIEVAIGGRQLTTTIEGRERYAVRVRYKREFRDQIDSLERILVEAPGGAQIPLGQMATIQYRPGPQAIKSEDTFLVGYVIFDKLPEFGEVDTVEAAQAYLAKKIEDKELILPAGVSYRFAGNYENQIRSEKKLRVVLPLALFIIFMILYFQFRSVTTTFMVFSGILVAWAGGFIMLWFYGQDWFLNFTVFDTNMRDLFQVHPMNLSVAVWVGFLALFGIASDNGVILATYLIQSFKRATPDSVEAIREATVTAARRRIRPCLMTTGTTILALIPILTSSGRGSDIMIPMALPSMGGMAVVMITVFVVPVLYCAVAELRWKSRQ
jgi:Cu(I)/Ag(I) efflux system membrane protein CusA/SilA